MYYVIASAAGSNPVITNGSEFLDCFVVKSTPRNDGVLVFVLAGLGNGHE